MAALHRVGVADYAAQRANTLSGGQQQRGAIARALVQKAKIILADEPVASLDPVSARKVMEILRDLNKTDGLTVVVTLHQVDYALRYCDRVVALKAGKMVYDGPTGGLEPRQTHRHLRPGIRRRILGRSPAMIRRRSLIAGSGPSPPCRSPRCGEHRQAAAARRQGHRSSSRSCRPRRPRTWRATGSRILADMEKATGLKVKPFFSSNYTPLIEADGRQADRRGLVLQPVGPGGGAPLGRRGLRPHLRPVGARRLQVGDHRPEADSKMTVQDLLKCDKTLNFGIGDKKSTSGTLAPMTYLFIPADKKPETCFKTVLSASHDANLFAVANDKLDAADQQLHGPAPERASAKGGAQAKKVKVIWESPTLPEDPIVWRKDLDPALKEKVAPVLPDLRPGRHARSPPSSARTWSASSMGGFKAADDTHLLVVREMEALEQAGPGPRVRRPGQDGRGRQAARRRQGRARGRRRQGRRARRPTSPVDRARADDPCRATSSRPRPASRSRRAPSTCCCGAG